MQSFMCLVRYFIPPRVNLQCNPYINICSLPQQSPSNPVGEPFFLLIWEDIYSIYIKCLHIKVLGKTKCNCAHNHVWITVSEEHTCPGLVLGCHSSIPMPREQPQYGILFRWQTKGQVKSPTAREGQKLAIISQAWSLDPGPQQKKEDKALSSLHKSQVITAESLTLLHCHSNSSPVDERGGPALFFFF